MNFLENIFKQLETSPQTHFLQEMPDGKPVAVTGGELLEMICRARTFLSQKGLKKGDRCALLAHNSIRWVAMDLALMAEGLIVVPLYARQATAELVSMMKDCLPEMICCGDVELQNAIRQNWPESPPQFLFDEILATRANTAGKPQLADNDPAAIIYTSGTSGEAKGVIINVTNVGFILERTAARLDVLMGGSMGQERVYHYLPFCFCASWIALLTYLTRRSLVTLNLDLTKISSEMRAATPDYFLNVPALLERMRKAVDEQLWKTSGIVLSIYTRAKAAWMRKQEGKARASDALWLGVANALVFPAIRKKMLGPKLKGLISGSAPLNMETQQYFAMLGIPVLQVYGLTETTGICTLDDPRRVIPGRVGPAIDGLEMKLGENDEILVRGLNVFTGYARNRQGFARRVVSYRGSGRGGHGGKLAYRGKNQEPDYSRLGS